MKSNEYFEYCERMTASIKRMPKQEAFDYLSKKYPDAHIFSGAIYGGVYDVLVAQIHNINFDEFEDEYVDAETIIII